MIAASYIFFMKSEKYHIHFLLVLFEPAGWFLLWTGLDHLVNSPKETKKDIDFYLESVYKCHLVHKVGRQIAVGSRIGTNKHDLP